jgi:type III secretion protein U
LRRAREEGDLDVSVVLSRELAFVAALALVPAAVTATAARASEMLRVALVAPAQPIDPTALVADVFGLTLPLLGAAALAATAAGLVQTGGTFAAGKLLPDWRRLNPLSGLSARFGWTSVIAMARAVVATCIVGWLAVSMVSTSGADLVAALGSPVRATLVAGELSTRLAWIVALVGLGLASADVVAVRHLWLRRMRMTRWEVDRERREAEGDPELQAARLRAHKSWLRGAALADVREATVVVTDERRLATALSYREGSEAAPRVIAQARGTQLGWLLGEAQAGDVPLVDDAGVARALQHLAVGDEIPEASYEPVAEVLRRAWSQRDDARERPSHIAARSGRPA